jgi:HSP20 family protein
MARLNKESSGKEPRGMMPVDTSRLPSTFADMERWFEEMFRRPFFAPGWMPRFGLPELKGEFSPSVDIFEEGDHVVVKAEIPGMRKEDLEVSLTEDVITISGQKKGEEKIDRKDFFRYERSFGSFTRTLNLPAGVRSEEARASFKDGVLEVRIPRTPPAQGKKVTIE